MLNFINWVSTKFIDIVSINESRDSRVIAAYRTVLIIVCMLVIVFVGWALIQYIPSFYAIMGVIGYLCGVTVYTLYRTILRDIREEKGEYE